MPTYSNETKFDSKFDKALIPLIRRSDCNEFTVASGYVGIPILKRMEAKLVAVAKRGVCRIIIGMIYHEGCSQNTKLELEKLDSKLRAVNSASGIFITRFQYHGKIYKVANNNSVSLFVGSSNFSDMSWNSRIEFNISVDDTGLKLKTIDFINYLFNHKETIALGRHQLKIKSKGNKKVKISKELKSYIVPNSEYDALPSPIGQFEHLLRVDSQPKSSLNLFFDKGRSVKGKNRYAPRPWYEVELTFKAEEIKNPLYPKTILNPKRKKRSSNSRIGEFVAYIKDGNIVYKIGMKVHASKGKNISSADEFGGRSTLGQYLKGKLQNAGVLSEGQRITSDILAEYGRDTVIFKKINDTTYVIDFTVHANGNSTDN